MEELRKATSSDKALFEKTVKQMLEDLEQAYHALMGGTVMCDVTVGFSASRDVTNITAHNF